jgi:hypothetical protein
MKFLLGFAKIVLLGFALEKDDFDNKKTLNPTYDYGELNDE